MQGKSDANAWVRWLLVLALALALTVIPTRAEGAEETQYIVQYKQSVAWLLHEPSGVPFDVVSEEELDRLLNWDLLEWYEEDIDLELLEMDPQGELLAEGSLYDPRRQWNLELIGAETGFIGEWLGQGVIVGVIDSGIAPHPAFGDRLLPGHNYIENASDPNDTTDTYGHGTMVAGLIAGADTGGYIGVAPMARLVPLKCTDGKYIKMSAICLAIYGGVDDYHCDVLNMSLGVPGGNKEFKALQEAVAYAAGQGVVIVAAAGNSNSSQVEYPAGFDTVIGVGNVNRNGERYTYTNFNSSVFLSAPGFSVRSTAYTGGYATNTGTSFSAPQVTGAVAVMIGIAKAKGQKLSLEEIKDVLAQTAVDRGKPGYDVYYGFGILNLTGCVAALTGCEDFVFLALPDDPAVGIYNTTGQAAACLYLLAEYGQDGRLLSAQSFALTIPAMESVRITAPDGAASFGQFLCQADTLMPLIPARRSP